MKDIFAKTFGGLTNQYLARQLFFGIAMAAGFIALTQRAPESPGAGFVAMMLICAVLYPYSRFVYESIFNFIIGDNFFMLPAAPMMIAKIFMMVVCFALAPLIAPIGLAYLYFRHSRT